MCRLVVCFDWQALGVDGLGFGFSGGSWMVQNGLQNWTQRDIRVQESKGLLDLAAVLA